MPLQPPSHAVRTVLLAIGLVAAGLLIWPERLQASEEAMYQDSNGGYYCKGECRSGGCCDRRMLPAA